MNTYDPAHINGRRVIVICRSWLGFRQLESGWLVHDGEALWLENDQEKRLFSDAEIDGLQLVAEDNRIPECQDFDFFLLVEPPSA